MSISEKLEMLVSLNPKDGIKGLESLSKKAEETEKSVGSSLSKIGTSAMKLGVGGLAAGGFLTAMADKDIASMNSLKAAIGQAGQSYDDYSERIEGAVKSQVKFGHTDGEVTEALSTLTLSYNDTGKALDQMQLVADLAAKKHISLADAASIVAKAHGGAGKVFKEFGITVGENADGTKNYDGALTDLAGKLQGQAAAGADTFTGKLSALRAEVENQISAFGEKYGPAIMAVSAATTAFGGIASGVGAILNKLKLAHEAAAAAAEGEATAEGLSKGAMLGVVGAVGALAAAYAYGKSHAEEFHVELDKLTDSQIDQVLSTIEKGARLVGMSMADLARTMPIEQAQRLADALDRQGQSSDEVRAVIANQQQAQDETKASTDRLAASTDSEAAAQKRAAEAAQRHDEAIKSLHDTLHAQIDPLFALEKALAENAKAQADANTAMTDGKHSADDIAAANMNVASTALSVHDASIALADAMQNQGLTVDGAKAQLNEWVAQGLITQGQADQVAGSLQGVADKASALDGWNVALTVNADAIEANRVIDEIEARIANDPLLKFMGVSKIATGPQPDGRKIGHNAAGTNYWGGGLSVVGELGPELVNLPRGSQVIPNHHLVGVGSQYGNQPFDQQGQFHVHLHMAGATIIGQDLRKAGEQLMEHVRRAGLKKSERNPVGVIGWL